MFISPNKNLLAVTTASYTTIELKFKKPTAIGGKKFYIVTSECFQKLKKQALKE